MDLSNASAVKILSFESPRWRMAASATDCRVRSESEITYNVYKMSIYVYAQMQHMSRVAWSVCLAHG